jgi:geranylgeranyl reductase family protein
MYDAVIIGAGPGGAAAAVALAQKGLTQVALVDRDGFPRDKTCGSGLSPTALTLVDAFGIGDEVRRRSYPVETVRVVTQGGRQMVLNSDAAAVVLLRRHFDHLLVERAQALGVKLLAPFKVTELLRTEGRVVGVRGADGTELKARMVLCADGANSIFSVDPRPKRSISTLMGWWDGARVTSRQLDMVFDRSLSPLYGWLFPESDTRVNIGICVDGQDEDGLKAKLSLRELFQSFLDKHYREVLRGATQVGRWKGHPIVHTTWIDHLSAPGQLMVGEAARITHHATGEGISQAMQSGLFAAEAVERVVRHGQREEDAFAWYLKAHRRHFTAGFVAGHALRGAIASPLLDTVAGAYNNPTVRRWAVRLLGSALAGTPVGERRP